MFEEYSTILDDLEDICIDKSALQEVRKSLGPWRESFSDARIRTGAFKSFSSVTELTTAWNELRTMPGRFEPLFPLIKNEWDGLRKACSALINAARENDHDGMKAQLKSLADTVGMSEGFQNLKKAAQKVVDSSASALRPAQ
jgi:hypothetical protein